MDIFYSKLNFSILTAVVTFFILSTDFTLAEEQVLTPGIELYKDTIDNDGDKIIVLDKAVRVRINAGKAIKETTIYDDEKKLEDYKANVEKIVLTKEVEKFGEYIVVKGDSLKLISQKLYGTIKKWEEIQVLNEDKLHNQEVKVGLKLKYKFYTEEQKIAIKKGLLK